MSTILILDDQQFNKMADCLPKICESMCGLICLRLVDLQYLSRMFHVIQNQLNAYTLFLPDVVAYTTTAYTSVNFIEPPPNASKHVLYPQLFDESKTIL